MQTTISQYINNLFPQFEPALKQLLAEVATLKTFAAGEMMMETGQYFKSTVLIVEGRAKLYRQGEEGGEFFMYYLEPGNACALSLICATKQETSEVMAKALEDTTVLMIPIGMMDDLMKNYKTWYYFVLETYRTRFQELLEVIDGVTFKGLDERLMFYLTNQYKKLKTRQLSITHQEIATDLNSSREVISRLLKKMEQRGELSLQRNYIEWLK
ncbi:Crp/Fnr family transcriptional regulator [Pedobacter cryophilus]|uniref:Crp/Fnr family transcriptional regulator n=1 Tax=Pedobacter cryophilus TaxID=2571271 RepID=A0A4U1BY31_9SPHI|nr:Crp/Fnr family transcriptional regulator [Pedobacter cryophilus]TKB97675.1 Crp/Fnr family transcriptional regulator [Pedobacter cryophilus]